MARLKHGCVTRAHSCHGATTLPIDVMCVSALAMARARKHVMTLPRHVMHVTTLTMARARKRVTTRVMARAKTPWPVPRHVTRATTHAKPCQYI